MAVDVGVDVGRGFTFPKLDGPGIAALESDADAATDPAKIETAQAPAISPVAA